MNLLVFEFDVPIEVAIHWYFNRDERRKRTNTSAVGTNVIGAIISALRVSILSLYSAASNREWSKRDRDKDAIAVGSDGDRSSW